MDRTSHEIDKYVSNKDTPFIIRQQPNGLYFIHMLKGGASPSICQSLYRGYGEAEKVLIAYLKKTDRLGYAKYPGKGS